MPEENLLINSLQELFPENELSEEELVKATADLAGLFEVLIETDQSLTEKNEA